MKILVAMDSFKESMTSHEAGCAVRDGILQRYPDAEIIVRQMSDGGEGFVDAIASCVPGERVDLEVTGPLNEPVRASYYITSDSNTAFIESASACGLMLIDEDRRNPLYTTTYGLGELIRDAAERGVRDYVIGLGGSGTNDGGAGMLQALGYRFLDSGGSDIRRGAIGLKDLKEIDDSGAMTVLKGCRFEIASDVTNPLCGPCGASYVFAPQKGAGREDVALMDGWMSSYAGKTALLIPDADKDSEGSGSAGGLGFAFRTYLGGVIASGADLVIHKTGLEELVRNADIVITGEGRIDSQSSMGKATVKIARLGRRYGKRTIGIGGLIADGAVPDPANGFAEMYEVMRDSDDDYLDPSKARYNMIRTASAININRQ
ncbi:glycerate kinase [Ruminococcaceae bacterium YRB3002]|nr:glycerate kinase [Ruminococcaceae bacterium YRB3002]